MATGTVSAPTSPSRRARTALYMVLVVALALTSATGLRGWSLAGLVVAGALAIGAVLARERCAAALLVVAWLATLLSTQAFLVPATLNLGVHRRRGRDTVALGLTFVVLALVAPRGENLVSIDGVDLDAGTGWASWLLNGVVVVLFPYLLGTGIAARREATENYRLRAEQAEAERSARAAQAVLLERARIAREAHDVLGHKLALLSMQAGGLELNAHLGPVEVERHARLIRQTVHAALEELRTMIGLIEAPADGIAEPEPDLSGVVTRSRGSDAIVQLVEESRRSGALVDLVTDRLDEHAVPDGGVARTAYRMVQESLTNAHRHSPGAPVRVELADAPDDVLLVEVRNARTDHQDAEPPHGGRGLPGLHEQVRQVGGELSVTQTDELFIVRAELPRHREPRRPGGDR